MNYLSPYQLKPYNFSITPAVGVTGSRGPSPAVKLLYKNILKTRFLGQVADFGAGIGLLSLPLTRYAKLVYSVEWDIRSFNALTKNIEDNSLTNIIPVFSDNLSQLSYFDQIIINAPVHLGREAILNMIHQAHQKMNYEQQLYFIAKRNFGAKWYHQYLKKLFKLVEVLDISGGFRTLCCSGKNNFSYPHYTRLISNRYKQRLYKFKTMPGIFSRKRIDPGSKILIEKLKPRGTLIDFGAGYGAMGISLSEKCEKVIMSECNLTAFRCLWHNLGINEVDNCEICLSGNLYNYPPHLADFFIVNPPTHSGGNTADLIISEAHRLLKTGGQMLCVVFRPGSYYQRMKNLFENAEITAVNNYSIISSVKL
ncbi:MAG: methyltransferase [bacterium]